MSSSFVSDVSCFLLVRITRDVHTGLHHFDIFPQYLKVTSSQLEIPLFRTNMDVEATSEIWSNKTQTTWAPMHDGHTRRSRRWQHLGINFLEGKFIEKPWDFLQFWGGAMWCFWMLLFVFVSVAVRKFYLVHDTPLWPFTKFWYTLMSPHLRCVCIAVKQGHFSCWKFICFFLLIFL